MKMISVFFAGLLFSAGLMVSGMVNPAKVLGFLDLFGAWDASLAFVMAGAIAVTFIGYNRVLRKPGPLFESHFSLPTSKDIDRNLLLGASLFGIGWGLVGLCPGPAITSLAIAPSKVGIFVLSMLIGMLLPRLLSHKTTTQQPH